MRTLEGVIDEIMRCQTQSPSRLAELAEYAKEQLAVRGLPGARGGKKDELRIHGMARSKDWDVAYNFAGKNRLLISLKSIWKNPGGTVPNRIDDLMGETANVQQMAPEIVTGYILLFDTSIDTRRQVDGQMWSDFLEAAVKRIAIRKAPLWNQGLLEGAWIVRVDSTRPFGSRVIDPLKTEDEGDQFFRELVIELRRREPAIPFKTKGAEDEEAS